MSTSLSSSSNRNWIEFIGELVRNLLTPMMLPILERNLVPDFLIRAAITRELEMELSKIKKLSAEEQVVKLQLFVDELKKMPIAIATTTANDQHYEVPDEFYQEVLGPCLKYSSGYWPTPNTTLPESEIHMLEMYCERAEIEDGMTLIDLGCGWGSVTLYMAQKYPKCQIYSISNSNTQREYIMNKAKERGCNNVKVFTGDIVNFDLPKEMYGCADRLISIEMFEHMKNYQKLMEKISRWVAPKGKMFIHIFTHKDVPSHYESGWMTDNFFTGGTLPSDNLLLYFQDHFRIEKHWRVNGTHYSKTLEGWLKIMDSKKAKMIPLLEKAYGKGQGLKWYVNWRLFFIGCAMFFGFRNGEEYMVSHYLFKKP